MAYDDTRSGSDELLLPPERMLVAAVHGEPHPHLGLGPRSSFLCATSTHDAVTRDAAGRLVWSERHAPPGSLLPRDWGAETLAMTDASHLADWVNTVEAHELTRYGVTGVSEHHGRYRASTHPEHRFVTSVSVAGTGAWRTLVEMTAYRVVDRDDVLLSTADVDSRLLLDRLV